MPERAEPAATPPSTPWVDEAIVVEESRIAGRGLFTAAPLGAGRVVIRLGGRLVTTTELEQLMRDATEYVDTLTVFEDAHLVLPTGTSVHFANHSCDPTMWHVGPYDIALRHAVEAGEELTIDYGTNSGAPGFSMPCTCGAPTCRGVVTSEDWRLPALQAAYAGHWSPALAERIRAHGGGEGA